MKDLPKPNWGMEHRTHKIRWLFVAGGEHRLQEEWRLESGDKEWRDVPVVMDEESGVSLG